MLRIVLCAITLVAQLLIWDIGLVLLVIFDHAAARRQSARLLIKGAQRLLAICRAWFGFRYSVAIPSDLPPNFLILANHQSLLDIALLNASFRRHSLRFVAKRSLYRGFPAVSWTLRLQRNAFINRKGAMITNGRAISRLAQRAQGAICPVIFPEGTRSRDGTLTTFHTGAARILLAARSLPIVCVAIDGTWRVAERLNIRHPNRQSGTILLRLAVVQCYPAPQNRDALFRIIVAAQKAVAAQINAWRVIPDHDT